jgi:hypothetical protein
MIFGLSYTLIQYFTRYYDTLYKFEKQKNNHGVFREYYSDGELKSLETYYKSERHGLSIYFSRIGDTIEYGTYNLGQKHGIFKFFTNSGKLVIQDVYNNGFLIQHYIVNDSLYQYEYKATETGFNAFEHACAGCHSSIDEIKEFKDTSLFFNRLDTIHLCLLDTISDSTTLKNYILIQKNQLESIRFYIQNIKESSKNQKNQIRINRNIRKRIVGDFEPKRPFLYPIKY